MMTTNDTTTRTSDGAATFTRTVRAPTVIAPRGRRRPGLVTAGIALALAGALVAVWLVAAAGDRTDVVVLARDVGYGVTLAAEDLAVAAVAAEPSVSVVSADDVASVVGMVAASDLRAGSLLSTAQLTASGPPGPGEVLVPLPVGAERLPAGGLVAGDRLLVVDTPSVDGDPPQTEPRTFDVSVVRVGAADLNGVSVLDVAAAEGDGPALAARAATGRFALVLLAPDGAQS